MPSEKAGLHIVGGTDVSMGDARDRAYARRIEELLAAENLDLEALARELGQLGPLPEEGTPTVSAKTVERRSSPVLPQQQPGQVSFMITNAQKEKLRGMGFGEDAIRDMTPVEAHNILRSGQE